MQKWIESKEIWETTKDVENVARENSTMGTTQKKTEAMKNNKDYYLYLK